VVVDLSLLEQRLGHTFTDPELLRRAMCHRSWVAESIDTDSNERLEFLGDAVLGWVIADIVYQGFSDQAEGALTDLRKSVVNAIALAEVAAELHIGDHLLLGRGEDAAGGRLKVSILSDAMEAVLGAVYLDGGKDAAYDLIGRLFTARLEAAVSTLDRLDYKSALQELTATRNLPSPEYSLRSTGPDHDKTFFAVVKVAKEVIGEGEGRSKKSAEQAAAAAAFNALTADPMSDA
jgi:ribonuclease III